MASPWDSCWMPPKSEGNTLFIAVCTSMSALVTSGSVQFNMTSNIFIHYKTTHITAHCELWSSCGGTAPVFLIISTKWRLVVRIIRPYTLHLAYRTHWTGEWVGLRASMDAIAKRKSTTSPEIRPWFSGYSAHCLFTTMTEIISISEPIKYSSI